MYLGSRFCATYASNSKSINMDQISKVNKIQQSKIITNQKMPPSASRKLSTIASLRKKKIPDVNNKAVIIHAAIEQ